MMNIENILNTMDESSEMAFAIQIGDEVVGCREAVVRDMIATNGVQNVHVWTLNGGEAVEVNPIAFTLEGVIA